MSVQNTPRIVFIEKRPVTKAFVPQCCQGQIVKGINACFVEAEWRRCVTNVHKSQAGKPGWEIYDHA